MVELTVREERPLKNAGEPNATQQPDTFEPIGAPTLRALEKVFKMRPIKPSKTPQLLSAVINLSCALRETTRAMEQMSVQLPTLHVLIDNGPGLFDRNPDHQGEEKQNDERECPPRKKLNHAPASNGSLRDG